MTYRYFFECRNAIPALLANVFLIRAFVKSVAARCDFRAKNTPKCVCGQDFAPDHTGRAYSAPQTPQLVFRGNLQQERGGEEKGREARKGEEEKGRGGSVPPLLLFHNLTTGHMTTDQQYTTPCIRPYLPVKIMHF